MSPDSLTYDKALKACKKVGTAHAAGDALRAMYAAMIAQLHGGDARRFYAHLRASGDDNQTVEMARLCLRDRSKAWDVLMEAPHA